MAFDYERLMFFSHNETFLLQNYHKPSPPHHHDCRVVMPDIPLFGSAYVVRRLYTQIESTRDT